MNHFEKENPELILEMKDIILGIRDLIELLKLEKVNPFINEDNSELVEQMNIENEKDRIIFQLKNNLPKLEFCVNNIENGKIKTLSNDLIQEHNRILSKFNDTEI